MIFNKEVNFTPQKPETCKPSTGLTCSYCRNERHCANKLPRDDTSGFDTKTSVTKIVCLDDPSYSNIEQTSV